MLRVQSYNNSDDDHVRRRPSLLRGTVEDYETLEDIIVVLPSGDIHIVIDHVKSLKE